MAATYTPKQRNWQWYSDATPDTSMSALAAENTKPTLADNNTIIRLRICIAETGGKADNNVTPTLQYDTDAGFPSPQSFGAAQHWNYANGAATEGGVVDTLLLSDTATANEYCESGANSIAIGASSTNEIDFAIIPTANVSGNTTYYFRFLSDGTAVPLDTGETYAQVTTAAAAVAYKRYPADDVGVTDSIFRVLAASRVIAESLGVTDAIYRSQGHIRYIGGEGEGAGTSYTREITDSVGITDSIFRSVGRNRDITESVGISDSLSKVAGYARTISESEGVSDSIVAAQALFRELTESVGVTDALTATLFVYINRFISENVGVTDSALRYATFVREATETLGVTDAQVIQAAYARYIAESEGMTDYLFRSQGHFREATEAVGMTDSVSSLLFVLIYRTVVESMGITDSADRYHSAVRFLSENLGVADSVDKASAHSREISEAVGVTDAVNRALSMLRTIADSVGMTDATLATVAQQAIAYTRIITEAMGITDAKVQATATVAFLLVYLSLQRLIVIEASDPFASVSVGGPFITLEAISP